MKKKNVQVYYIAIFILAQFAWLGLLGLWIYFYVSNNLIIKRVGNQLTTKLTINSSNVIVFVGGIVLIVAIAAGMSLLLRNLGVQIKLTRMYDDFIANITHELKSPLASIQLYLQTLKSRDVPKIKQKEFVGSMLQDAKRLQNLIDSILEISALDQKRIAHNFEIYDSGKIFRELLTELKKQLKLKDDILTIKGNPEAKCKIDPVAVKIVIANLLDNAIKYSNADIQIVVELKSEDNKIILLFSDNGIGIPPEEQKRIFNKFYRVYRNDIPNVKGTGLGLYLVKGIVKAHGGKINVESKGIDKGSNFILEFPVYNEKRKKIFTKIFTG